MKSKTPPYKSASSKLLLIVRHGKAAPGNVGLSDFERVLTEKGIEECKEVGKIISTKKLTIDLIISSPADRALETAHVFSPYLEYPILKIQISDLFYQSDAAKPIVKKLQELNDNLRSVAIFGHNPSFDDLAAYFISNFGQTIHKGAVVAITFPVDSWTKIDTASGKLKYMITPSESKKMITARK